MSLVATLLFKNAGSQIIAVWLETTVLNFPMAFCWQLFFAGPFVRFLFRNIFREKEAENENVYEIMLEIGRKRGCIISGGNIDEEKTARIILDEFKNGKLGKITLESPKK